MERSTRIKLEDNEAAFRTYNERVQNGFQDLKKLAKESGQEDLIQDDDQALRFYCECSNEDCKERIKLMPSLYGRIHQNRSHFIIVCGHNIPAIEHVIGTEQEFCVVEKISGNINDVQTLQKTDL